MQCVLKCPSASLQRSLLRCSCRWKVPRGRKLVVAQPCWPCEAAGYIETSWPRRATSVSYIVARAKQRICLQFWAQVESKVMQAPQQAD